MIEYLYGRDAELVPWAQERLRHIRLRPDAKTIGMAVDGVTRAVVCYDTFSTNDCLVHLASDGSRKWLTREFAVRAMAYPFTQCGLARISCLISSRNDRSIAFTDKFGGWVVEGVQREAGLDGEDLILFGMLKRDCRWLPLPLVGEGV